MMSTNSMAAYVLAIMLLCSSARSVEAPPGGLVHKAYYCEIGSASAIYILHRDRTEKWHRTKFWTHGTQN